MSKNNVLISGYIGFSNFGDDAMLSVLVEHLKELDFNIMALTSNQTDTKEKFDITPLRYMCIKDILNGILNSSTLISGGGNLIQNETSSKSLFYYLFIIFLAKLFHKKVILFSQGIGPVDGALSLFFTKLILKQADLITVRDVHSQRILSKWGIKSKFSYDAVWNLECPEAQKELAIGLQVRKYKHLHKDFYNNLAKYVDMFFSEYEIRIFSMENLSDLSECYKLERALKKRNIDLKIKIISYNSPKETAIEISKLRYLIGMRLHSLIAGMKLNVKVLPLVYSSKVLNLAKDFDIPYLFADKEGDFHSAFSDLTAQDTQSPKILDAKKRKFDWGYFDDIINKK